MLWSTGRDRAVVLWAATLNSAPTWSGPVAVLRHATPNSASVTNSGSIQVLRPATLNSAPTWSGPVVVLRHATPNSASVTNSGSIQVLRPATLNSAPTWSGPVAVLRHATPKSAPFTSSGPIQVLRPATPNSASGLVGASCSVARCNAQLGIGHKLRIDPGVAARNTQLSFRSGRSQLQYCAMQRPTRHR